MQRNKQDGCLDRLDQCGQHLQQEVEDDATFRGGGGQVSPQTNSPRSVLIIHTTKDNTYKSHLSFNASSL